MKPFDLALLRIASQLGESDCASLQATLRGSGLPASLWRIHAALDRLEKGKLISVGFAEPNGKQKPKRLIRVEPAGVAVLG